MKHLPLTSILSATLLLVGCQSVFGPRIGMTERQWLSTTLIADVVYAEGDVKAYRSGGGYYYFRDGVLVKIDQGVIPASKIEMEIRSQQEVTTSGSGDLYSDLTKLDGLRKEGIINDEEFQSQKKKILERE